MVLRVIAPHGEGGAGGRKSGLLIGLGMLRSVEASHAFLGWIEAPSAFLPL